MFSARDKEVMQLAIAEARKALTTNEYPIGAVIVANGEVLAVRGHTSHGKQDWASHAESLLITEHSALIKMHAKDKKAKIELFTTLEPCIMCLGSAVLHRISRIVYACPDPHGGATKINISKLSTWYKNHWPKIEGELFKKEAYDILMQFLSKKPSESELLKSFAKLNL